MDPANANDATVLVESVDTGGEILTASISGSISQVQEVRLVHPPTWQGGLGQGAQINVTKTNPIIHGCIKFQLTQTQQ